MTTTRPWRIGIVGVLVLWLATFVAPAGAQTTTTQLSNSAKSTTAPPKAWIVVDAGTGVILDGEDIHTPLRPASTVKLMTALTVAERLPFSAEVTASELAASQPSRRLGMTPGSKWNLGDLLYVLLLASANDVAYALAERAGGDINGFAAEMTATGERIGLADSTFNDPAGLDAPNEGHNGGSTMSAYDLAVVARNVLADPYLAPIVASRTATIPGQTEPVELINHNIKFLDSYDGANGMKTGYTERAGRTLVASAERGGRTLIAVVLDTYDINGWTKRLLDSGFATPASSKGIGESVPNVKVVSAEANAAVFAALPLVLGRPAATVDAVPVATTTPSAPPVAEEVTTTAPPTTETRSVAATNAAASTDTESGGGINWFTLFVGVLFVFGALVTLRVRAVHRRRARRAAHLRQFRDARRRGALTVVDHDQWTDANHVRTVTDRR